MRWYAILAIPAVLVAASSAQEKKTAKDQKPEAKEAEKTETPPQRRQKPMQIPADAKEIRPGLWRWVDKSGQPWIYWNSPFGVARSPEEPGKEIKPATQAAPEQSGPAGPEGGVEVDGVTIIEEGDNVRFERRTPFGVSKLAKKKSELTGDEKRLWERARTLKAAAGSTDSKK